ncbi:type II secretion system protein GspL [Uliginosibacterium sp. sgz301328]|uniref:type II secretion system protein GspL n=1 Tax=Uliginosibacterium sp. sgz301328 TaxID=3243764 RepID=UPI00359CE198
MKTLRLLIAENWPERPETAWVLLGEDGKPEAQGTSDPRHWPAAQRTEAILLGAQISLHTVRVPRTNVREQTRALGFALEELLVREADSQHATALARGEEQWAVAVVARERLRRLVAQFAAILRPLDGAYVVAQTVPLHEGAWTVAVHDQEAWVRTGPCSGFADDVVAGTPPVLTLAALDSARAAGTLPHSVHVVETAPVADRNAWTEAFGVMPLEWDDEWQWHLLPMDAANLLQGEFSPRHRRGTTWKMMKMAAIVAGAALALHLVLGIGDVLIKRSRVTNARAEMTQLLRSQMPGVPALDPAAQLHREVNVQRAARGQLADDDLLAMLDDLSNALGADATSAVQTLRFENGSLEVTLVSGKADPAGLMQRLATRGIKAASRDSNPLHLVMRREA